MIAEHSAPVARGNTECVLAGVYNKTTQHQWHLSNFITIVL